MLAYFNQFILNISKTDSETGSHAGRCDDDIAYLRKSKPRIESQLKKLDPEMVKAELKEYGTWDENELQDHQENLNRVLWLACGQV